MTTYTTRTEVPLHEKWDLTDLYSEQSKWEEDYQQIEKIAKNLKRMMEKFITDPFINI